MTYLRGYAAPVVTFVGYCDREAAAICCFSFPFPRGANEGVRGRILLLFLLRLLLLLLFSARLY